MNNHQRRCTLKDIARELGLSKMTVSRALRNAPGIRSETRAAILEKARELNYVPDPKLAALQAYRHSPSPGGISECIALIATTSMDRNNDFVRAVELKAAQLGYQTEIFRIGEGGLTAARCSSILFHRGVRGLIVAPLARARGRIKLQWHHFASVAVGYSLVWPVLHRICNHQYRSMQVIMRKLRQLGYRRIGLAIRSDMDERVDHSWLAGYLVHQRRFPSAQTIPPYMPRAFSDSDFREWFSRCKPDVVVAATTGIYERMTRMKTRIPQDAGFVMTNVQSGEKFSGINQKWDVLAGLAVEQLVALIQRSQHGIPVNPTTLLLDGEWVEGTTVRNLLPERRVRRS